MLKSLSPHSSYHTIATRIYTIEEFRALDKSLWAGLFREWNRRKGTIKRIPKVAAVRTSAMSPKEARQVKKLRQTKKIEYAYDLEWEEVPQHLPYVFGCYRPATLDPKMVYVDEDFLTLVEHRATLRRTSHISAASASAARP